MRTGSRSEFPELGAEAEAGERGRADQSCEFGVFECLGGGFLGEVVEGEAGWESLNGRHRGPVLGSMEPEMCRRMGLERIGRTQAQEVLSGRVSCLLMGCANGPVLCGLPALRRCIRSAWAD